MGFIEKIKSHCSRTLLDFCEHTSLHGWRYIFTGNSPWRHIWVMIVCASIMIASFFIFTAASDFNRSTVVTTIHSTTESLDEVYFPAVTICNINQVRQSFFLDMDLDYKEQEAKEIIRLLYRQFYSGSDRNASEIEQGKVKHFLTSPKYVAAEFNYHKLTQIGDKMFNISDSKAYLEKFRELIEKGAQLTRLAVQEPLGHMILKASFGKRTKMGTSKDFMPYFGTDYGICSIIKPQTVFDPELEDMHFKLKTFGEHKKNIKKGAEVGRKNGLTILLDTETFDYSFHLKASEGFKIAIHHHLDQPIMSIKELDISPGSVFQVAVTPTLLNTSLEAKNRFSPEARGCYFEGELPLKYLPSNLYRYEMSNCLFEAAYEEILAQCNCTPSFHALGFKEKPVFCLGYGLTCMNRIIKGIGKYNTVGDDKRTCMAACEDQVNAVSVTSSHFPNRKTFVERVEFCILVKKLIRTCSKPGKYYVLVKFYPEICEYIWNVTTTTSKDPNREAMCKDNIWSPHSMGYSEGDPRIQNLEDMLFIYAKNNLAVVNIYIKEPVVTRIWRDQKISIISFVAHTGGLLGLCMGFSLVSLFEIVYYTFNILPWRNKRNLEDNREQQLYDSQLSNDTPEKAAFKKNGLFCSPPGLEHQETPTDSIRTVGSCLELEYAHGGQIVTRRMDTGRRSVERLL